MNDVLISANDAAIILVGEEEKRQDIFVAMTDVLISVLDAAIQVNEEEEEVKHEVLAEQAVMKESDSEEERERDRRWDIVYCRYCVGDWKSTEYGL